MLSRCVEKKMWSVRMERRNILLTTLEKRESILGYHPRIGKERIYTLLLRYAATLISEFSTLFPLKKNVEFRGLFLGIQFLQS